MVGKFLVGDTVHQHLSHEFAFNCVWLRCLEAHTLVQESVYQNIKINECVLKLLNDLITLDGVRWMQELFWE